MSSDQDKAEADLDLGPLEQSKGRSAFGLIVAIVIAGGAIGALLYADYKRADKPMLAQQTDEDFKFRAARLPEPPRERMAPVMEANRSSVRQRAEDERARREAEAAEHARRLQAESNEQSTRQSRVAAEKALADRQKRELERRRSPMLVGGSASGSREGRESRSEAAPPAGDAYVAARMQALAGMQAGAGTTPGANTGEPERAYAFVPGTPTNIASTSATLISADLARRIRQGKVIPGVLKTAISSDHPGLVTAVVQEDVYSDDGSQVLIPRGSDLIGEYRSGTRRGQSRVFVVWRRLARPDGIDVSIESPGADSLGVAGLEGDVDNHFFERFGAAIVLSFIEVQAEQSRDSVALYAGDAQRTSELALRDSINIPPTIHVDQGARINVMVARDLYFGAGFGP